jgi:hypothetical protein
MLMRIKSHRTNRLLAEVQKEANLITQFSKCTIIMHREHGSRADRRASDFVTSVRFQYLRHTYGWRTSLLLKAACAVPTTGSLDSISENDIMNQTDLFASSSFHSSIVNRNQGWKDFGDAIVYEDGRTVEPYVFFRLAIEITMAAAPGAGEITGRSACS